MELEVQTDWSRHHRGVGQRRRSPYSPVEADQAPAQGNVTLLKQQSQTDVVK